MIFSVQTNNGSCYVNYLRIIRRTRKRRKRRTRRKIKTWIGMKKKRGKKNTG